MGQETTCRVRFGRQSGQGKALLESRELIFRGDFRLRVPFKDIRALDVRDGELRVEWPEGTATFELGAAAPKWVAKIKNPPTLMDKLGVKPGVKVAVLGLSRDALPAEALLAELRARAGDVVELSAGRGGGASAKDAPSRMPRQASRAARARVGAGEARSASGKSAAAGDRDLVFVGLTAQADLPAIERARAAIHKDGGVWAVWVKGRKELREDDVRAFALARGLVDVKVASVSDKLSGLKLVIPRAAR